MTVLWFHTAVPMQETHDLLAISMHDTSVSNNNLCMTYIASRGLRLCLFPSAAIIWLMLLCNVARHTAEYYWD